MYSALAIYCFFALLSPHRHASESCTHPFIMTTDGGVSPSAAFLAAAARGDPSLLCIIPLAHSTDRDRPTETVRPSSSCNGSERASGVEQASGERGREQGRKGASTAPSDERTPYGQWNAASDDDDDDDGGGGGWRGAAVLTSFPFRCWFKPDAEKCTNSSKDLAGEFHRWTKTPLSLQKNRNTP